MLAQPRLARRGLSAGSMDELACGKATRTRLQVVVLTHFSFVRLHTWQTCLGGGNHGQRHQAD
jgi:hypothetical protein